MISSAVNFEGIRTRRIFFNRADFEVVYGTVAEHPDLIIYVLKVHGLQWYMRDNISVVDDSHALWEDAHEEIEELLISYSGRSEIHESDFRGIHDFGDF